MEDDVEQTPISERTAALPATDAPSPPTDDATKSDI